MDENLKKLHEKAVEGQSHSYAPYSGFHIGSAVLTESGEIFIGCNVENSSFGATICAEQNAITNAASYGHRKIKEIVIVSENAWPPCGICRQVLSDFGSPDTKVHLATPEKIVKSMAFKDLFPESFNQKHLDIIPYSKRNS